MPRAAPGLMAAVWVVICALYDYHVPVCLDGYQWGFAVSELRETESGVLSVEYFAAKDGAVLVMMVPCKCGLNQADTLRIDGISLSALRNQSILPIDLPSLTESVRAKLVALSRRGEQLSVGEFMARGLFDSYSLNVVIV